MTTTPSRRRLGSGILGIITVIATLFSGLVATPATAAVPATAKAGVSQPAATPDYDRPDVIHGYLQDADGNPFVGATVQTLQPDSYTPITSAVTDQSGYFAFDAMTAGDYKLQAYSADAVHLGFYDGAASYPDATIVTVSDTQGAYILYVSQVSALPTPTGSVSGTVLDVDDAPVSAINVTLMTTDGTDVDTTTTDSSGNYTFNAVPDDTYTVCFSGSGYVDVCYGGAANYYLANTFDVMGGAATTDIDVTIEQAGGISGIVWPEWESSIGIDGTSVSAYQFNGWGWEAVATVLSDSNGRYEFDTLASGYYRVVADPSTSPSWF